MSEEVDDGAGYEIIDPLNTTNHTVIDRAAGIVIDAVGNPPQNIVKRTALLTMAWEGISILPSGAVIGGDELWPGSNPPEAAGRDADGGAIYKFIPATPWAGGGSISNLNESPLIAGACMRCKCPAAIACSNMARAARSATPPVYR